VVAQEWKLEESSGYPESMRDKNLRELIMFLSNAIYGQIVLNPLMLN
jgi:hypothetical protein